jgi:hypothetical protein
MGGCVMYLVELMTFCVGTRCADAGHMVMMAAFLAITLLLLNLPRVSVWAVDSWNQRRDGQRDARVR